MNESTMLGGNQGVVFAATLSARTHMKSIAQFGADEHGTGIGFDLTFELSGYAAASSPMSLGLPLARISVLPAFSVGSGSAPHFAIVIAPPPSSTAEVPSCVVCSRSVVRRRWRAGSGIPRLATLWSRRH